MQAVKVQTVETALPLSSRTALLVVLVQPADEVADNHVAPHPGREALEAPQRLLGSVVIAESPHVAVDPVGVGPVGLGRDRAEALLLDQPLCDLGASLVELVSAVRALADQHDARVANQLLQHFRRWYTCGRVHADAADHLCRCLFNLHGRPCDAGGRRGEKFADLLVADLAEVPERLPDGKKRRGHARTHHVVDQGGEFPAGRLRCGRYRDHDLGRVALAQCLHRGEHARSGCHPVVDENDLLARNVDRAAAPTIGGLAPDQFAAFTFGDVTQLLRCDPESANDVVIDNDASAASQRAHRELLVARCSELAHHERVQRRAECGCDLPRDGYPPSSQAENDDVVLPPVGHQQLCEYPSCLAAVSEHPPGRRRCRSCRSCHGIRPFGQERLQCNGVTGWWVTASMSDAVTTRS